MAKRQADAEQDAAEQGVAPEVAEQLREEAEDAGLPAGVAEEIIDEAISEGVAPEKVEEVVGEAIRVEAEDRQTVEDEELPDQERASQA